MKIEMVNLKNMVDALDAEEMYVKAMAAAMNKTAAKAETAISRKVRELYHVKAAKVKESILVYKPLVTKNSVMQIIRYRGRVLGLINFNTVMIPTTIAITKNMAII